MQADAHHGKRGGQHGAAAAAQDQPERSKKFGAILFHLFFLMQ
jgi:hypothetical protein